VRSRLVGAVYVATALGAAFPCVAPAQQSRDSTRFVLRGIVRDEVTHAPLGDVAVRTGDSGGEATTNGRGEFRIDVRIAGRVTVQLRRLGYDSLTMDVVVASAGEEPYVFDMLRTAQTLDTVAVSTRPTSWSPKLDGFEHRLARHNGGTFFTRDDIEQRRPMVVSELVRRSPAVRIVDSMGVRLFASSRGSKFVDGPRGRKSVPCIMRVGVDGQIMEWGFPADQIAPSEIYGVEVYSGPATIPREYASQIGDGFCGLVMIWTR
jgi:hypothetical protein